MVEPERGCLRICMASDFFYPNVGGVENHIYELGARLVARGHKVVVLTRSYGATHGRSGVRLLRTGVKVYYAPVPAWWRGTSLPTSVCTLALVRAVLVRERIDVVHTHQAGSALAHEAAYAAQLLGVPTVYTEHSLMDLRSLSSIALNMMMAFTLCDAAQVVCVSHCAKENLVLRAGIDPDMVSVIPNAINAENFAPVKVSEHEHAEHDKQEQDEQEHKQEKQDEPEQEQQEQEEQQQQPDENMVTVVLLSRLVYRKGVDLAVAAIPRLCRSDAKVRFVVGGDGPKRLALEEMREREGLQERVEMLGEVPHERVRAVLARGDVFLNCSLTEGFCIAVVEAAAAGLLVVTTAVGGIPEVLPRDMLLCAPPTVDGVVAAVTRALAAVRAAPAPARQQHRARQHARVARMYNWADVARRTERVYARALAPPRGPARGLARHLARKARLGWAAGPFWCALALLEALLLALCALLRPRAAIDPAREVPRSLLPHLCPEAVPTSPPPPPIQVQGNPCAPATAVTTSTTPSPTSTVSSSQPKKREM